YGNLGQSDYASANDYLSKLCINLQNLGQRALSVDMSAYSSVGMGVRSGVFEFLTQQGLKFVDPHDGMQIFLDEIVFGRVPEIILTDDLGKLDWDGQIRFNEDFAPEAANPSGALLSGGGEPTGSIPSPSPVAGEGRCEEAAVEPAQEPEPAKEEETPAAEAATAASGQENFFLGAIKTLEKGKELFSEHTFSADYPFLFDHAIEGTPYVPGVMGIETFMEAATALKGATPEGLEDVHFYLPIKLLRRNPQTVRVKGSDVNGSISMEIESDFINSKGIKMGNTRRHFTARPLTAFSSRWNNYKTGVDINGPYAVSKEELYSKYFHGPSFQVLDGILKVDNNAVLGVYQKPAQVLFHDGPKRLIAHPMLIEAAFQTCGWRDLAVDGRMTLPDSIGKIYINTKGDAPQKLYILGVFTGQNIEGKSVYDAFVFDEKGKLWIELADYQMIGQ
ncbi:MAG: polyketide synthase dehydratase domain-containing protein, partial [Elusimicrobiota bacterium]|nr:polyketide synthase dehydratase domain-containing protein [Elusimicrobiota bacterium]